MTLICSHVVKSSNSVDIQCCPMKLQPKTWHLITTEVGNNENSVYPHDAFVFPLLLKMKLPMLTVSMMHKMKLSLYELVVSLLLKRLV